MTFDVNKRKFKYKKFIPTNSKQSVIPQTTKNLIKTCTKTITGFDGTRWVIACITSKPGVAINNFNVNLVFLYKFFA